MTVAAKIVEADLTRAEHQRAIVEMTAAYALDPMGNNGPLADDVLARLIPGLQSLPTTVVFLAYAGSEPVGIATCFRGFSTYAGKPLINIHDLGVLATHRGQGVGLQLLRTVEQKARDLGCSCITLEVLERNDRARQTYEKFGFAQARSGADAGGSLFFSKRL